MCLTMNCIFNYIQDNNFVNKLLLTVLTNYQILILSHMLSIGCVTLSFASIEKVTRPQQLTI